MTNWEMQEPPVAKPAIPPEKLKQGRGRPFGTKNYSRNSYMAKYMAERGLSWMKELTDAYLEYKKQMLAGQTPDPTLLYFWQEILPYVSVKLIERETRGKKPKPKRKRKFSAATLEALAKAEGRKV